MGKKFLAIVSLFVLFMFINVKALTCEYSSGGVNIELESDNLGWGVKSSGYTAYGNSIKSPTNQCPSTIYYKCSGSTCYVADNPSSSSFPSYATGRSGSIQKSNQGSGSAGNGSIWNGSDSWWNSDCQSIFGDLKDFLERNVFKPIYFLTPIVLIVLTTIDFAKAVFADEKDGMKKAQGNFVKRALAALLIFLSPTIVEIVLALLDRTQC